MRNSQRTRSRNEIRTAQINAPWTKHHHRQRGHGPSGTRAHTGSGMHIAKFAMSLVPCDVPGCHSLTHGWAKDHPQATIVTVGRWGLIRNPRWFEGSTTQKPMLLIPMTRRVRACPTCWTAFNRVVKTPPIDPKFGRECPFLPDTPFVKTTATE